MALKFNNNFGEILTLPEAKIAENVAVVPGTDGAKMSKSYKNTIDIFGTDKQLKKQCNSVVTDSTPLEAPKKWQDCNIFNIAKLFLDENGQAELKARYERGGEGYGHFKAYLNELILDYYGGARSKYEYFITHKDEVRDILDIGAKKASELASAKMAKIRDLAGVF